MPTTMPSNGCGTVHAESSVAYHCWDDDFDIDNGYSGTCRHLLGIRHPRIADITGSHAFECSNNGTNTPATPTTAATFEDVTIYGPASGDASFVIIPTSSMAAASGLRMKACSAIRRGTVYGQQHIGAFCTCRISGYPDMEGTPASADNVVFSEREETGYPEWTQGWCNFNPQETEY